MLDKVYISALLVLTLFLVSCSEESTAPTQKPSKVENEPIVTQHMAEAVTIEAQAVSTPDGRVSVYGNSNLPDGTKLLVTLSNEKMRFSAQDKTSISNGQFSFVPLGSKTGLRPGSYVVEIIMPIPSVHPEHVKKIIGDKGQYLSGPLVSKSDLFDSKNVELSFSFDVGSAQEIDEAAEDRQTIYNELIEFQKLGVRMETMDTATCMTKMRPARARLEELKEQNIGFLENVVITELLMCVKCLRISAMESCTQAGDTLKSLK